jgi:hypothetical protein
MKAWWVSALVASGCNNTASPPPAPAPSPPREPAPRSPVAKPPPPTPAAPAPALPCFADAERIAIADGHISALAAGDFDRDGAPDIAMVQGLNDLEHMKEVDDEQVTILRNDGHGGLAPTRHWRADRSTLAVAVDDVDGDGVPDIITSAVVFDGTGRSSMHAYLGRGDGDFDSGATTTLGADASVTTTGDVTGDGHPEILVATPNTIDIYTATTTKLARKTRVPAGRFPQSAQLVDLDGDHDLDLVFLDHVSYELVVAINLGHGSFAAPTSIKTCVSPSGLGIVDLDRDGKLDAIVSCAGIRYADGHVEAPKLLAVVRGVASRGAVLETLDVPAVHDFVIGPLTGGSALDVFGTDDISEPFAATTRVSLLRADAGHVLHEAGHVDVAGQLEPPIAADLDRDGRLDVVAAMWTGRVPAVLIWRGRACPAPAGPI